MLPKVCVFGRNDDMTDKELKKLGRSDLLQMLVDQSRELRELKEKYAAAEAALADRTIRLDQAGSIAEAALQLNGVFEAAQEACRQYTDSIALLARQQEEVNARREAESQEKADRLLAETEVSCSARICQTEEDCAEKMRQTEETCQRMLSKAQAESQQYWDTVFQKMQAFSKEYAELKGLLAFAADKDKTK